MGDATRDDLGVYGQIAASQSLKRGRVHRLFAKSQMVPVSDFSGRCGYEVAARMASVGIQQTGLHIPDDAIGKAWSGCDIGFGPQWYMKNASRHQPEHFYPDIWAQVVERHRKKRVWLQMLQQG